MKGIVAFPLQQWLHERATILRYTYSKVKGKVHAITSHEGPEGEQMYSFTLP
jgi:hypothetical protein